MPLHPVGCEAVWAEYHTVKLLIEVGTRTRRCQTSQSKLSPSSRSDSCQKRKRWFCVGKIKWSILTVNVFLYPGKKLKKRPISAQLLFCCLKPENLRIVRNSSKKTSTIFASGEPDITSVAAPVKSIDSFCGLVVTAVVYCTCREIQVSSVYKAMYFSSQLLHNTLSFQDQPRCMA